MSEFKRHFFRTHGRGSDQRAERLQQWFFGMLDKMNEEAPVDFAALQFHAAMEGHRLVQERNAD